MKLCRVKLWNENTILKFLKTKKKYTNESGQFQVKSVTGQFRFYVKQVRSNQNQVRSSIFRSKVDLNPPIPNLRLYDTYSSRIIQYKRKKEVNHPFHIPVHVAHSHHLLLIVYLMQLAYDNR